MIPVNARHQYYQETDLYAWELPDGQWYWKAVKDAEEVNGGVSEDYNQAIDRAKDGARILARIAWRELWRWDGDLQSYVFEGTDGQWEAYMGYPRAREAK